MWEIEWENKSKIEISRDIYNILCTIKRNWTNIFEKTVFDAYCIKSYLLFSVLKRRRVGVYCVGSSTLKWTLMSIYLKHLNFTSQLPYTTWACWCYTAKWIFCSASSALLPSAPCTSKNGQFRNLWDAGQHTNFIRV